MRAAGNLAGVAFIDPPHYLQHDTREQWREVISESGYWFTKSAMRWHDSRVSWDTLTRVSFFWVFISSERDTYTGTPRRYTLRGWDHDNGVETISELGEYATLAAAKKALNTYINNTRKGDTN
jgi:hypothetical protein